MKVLIRRTGAFGDVIVATPVPRRIKRDDPTAEIHFLTQYPAVFDGNPDVTVVNPEKPDLDSYDAIIDLDLAFERRGRRLHATDCYFLEAFRHVGSPSEKQPWMAPLSFDMDGVGHLKDHVVIHPARSWPHRTFDQKFWQDIVDCLFENGDIPVVTGTAQDWSLERVIDTRDALTPRQQVALVGAARVLIASESGVLGGILPCTETPAVGIITMGTFEIAAPYRQGRLGAGFYPIYAKVDCHGCTTRQEGIVTYHGCERNDYMCVSTLSASEVVDLALSVS